MERVLNLLVLFTLFFFFKLLLSCWLFSLFFCVFKETLHNFPSQQFSVCLSPLFFCLHFCLCLFHFSHTHFSVDSLSLSFSRGPFSLCLFWSPSLSLSLPHCPPVFLDLVLRQSCGLMMTWQWRVYCIVRRLPVLPSAVLTVLSWMNEHTVLTQGATVSNNKSRFCSVKFYKLLDLVSLLGPQKNFESCAHEHKTFHLYYYNTLNVLETYLWNNLALKIIFSPTAGKSCDIISYA